MPQVQLPYDQFSDTELFSLTKQDKIAAFEELYRRHWADLINAAYKRLQSRQKAEDIVQDLFITLYQRRYKLEFTISLKAYLNQALKYKVLNEFRAAAVRASYNKTLFLKDVCKNDFEENLNAKELNKRIEQLLKQLPDKCRQVFLLSRKENLSNMEISLALNISVSTVEKHIGKALRTLRNNLKKNRHNLI